MASNQFDETLHIIDKKPIFFNFSNFLKDFPAKRLFYQRKLWNKLTQKFKVLIDREIICQEVGEKN
jgi:hypothetical protein